MENKEEIFNENAEAEQNEAEVKAESAATGETEETEEDTNDKKSPRALKKEIKKLEAENKELNEKAAELDDRYKRMAAEYDNFRKRSAKEREGVYADAYADALKEILPVIDNLERALSYETDTEDKLFKGVQITLNQFSTALEKMGVTSFGEKGEQFDPNIHNAVMHEENEELGENVITDVFQKGYKKGDKIIRYAMVKSAN